MRKILLENMCFKIVDLYAPMFLGASMMACCFSVANMINGDISVDLRMFLIMTSVALIISFGAIVPQSPKAAFLVPASYELRRKEIKFVVLGKMFLVVVIELAICILCAFVGVIEWLDVFVIVYGIATLIWGFSVSSLYVPKDMRRAGETVRVAFGVIGVFVGLFFLSILPSAYVKMFFRTLVIVSGLLLLYRPVKHFRGLLNGLSDYERLRAVTLPLEERAKLMEQGLL